MNIRTCFAVGLILTNFTAYGQTACPIGVAPGSPQCGPSPSSHGSAPPAQPQVRHVPTGRWHTTWGAIAITDNQHNDIGISVNQRSKHLAEEEAKNSCKQWGTGNCKILLAYHNQCAAVAMPVRNGKHIAGKSSVLNGPTIEFVESFAINNCQKSNGGGTCKLIYSDCTKPWFEKF